MKPDIWNLLHDGSIEGASGSVPGTVRLEIDIQYLREKFSDDGRLIILTLHGCSKFEFSDNKDNLPRGINEIANFCPEILSARDVGIYCEVTCFISNGHYGVIRVAADDFTLALDSGRISTLEELDSIAKAYWKDFGKR